VVVWFAGMYVAYSCAPQDIATWRPLIRDADRFLCGLVVPFVLLSIAGLWAFASSRWVTTTYARILQKIGRPGAHPPAWAVGVAAVVALWSVTSRGRFDLGFVPEFSAYMRALPAGTKVFTHEGMRAVAFLCDSEAARKLKLFAPNHILQRDEQNEADAAQCEEFWYAHKLMWMSTHKQLESGVMPKQPPLASFFDVPEREWSMKRVLARSNTPDLVFYRRRNATSPLPVIMTASSPDFIKVFPILPAQWTPHQKMLMHTNWTVPVALRGNVARIEIEAASKQIEPFTLRLRFMRGRSPYNEILLKPYLHEQGGKDFFALSIPTDTEKCELQLRFAPQTKSVNFTGFRVVAEAGEK